ncbi:MAG TPA: DapH/DapD/GlmU-related protein [Polyangiaceae bacterium]|nr:DapH/DapD/GlmU-related protein [Polyangiaceae bacterium]
MIHETANVEPGAQIGVGCNIWCFCHVRKGAVLQDGVSLGMGCYVAPSVLIGARSRIQNHVSLFDGVILEADVFVGPSAVFTNIARPRAFVSQKNDFRKTIVRQGASVGANATVLPGVTIGAFALIAAGAVVTRDVRAHEQVGGNPARHMGWVSERGEPLDFDPMGIACCPTGGETYLLGEGRVVRAKRV